MRHTVCLILGSAQNVCSLPHLPLNVPPPPLLWGEIAFRGKGQRRHDDVHFPGGAIKQEKKRAAIQKGKMGLIFLYLAFEAMAGQSCWWLGTQG